MENLILNEREGKRLEHRETVQAVRKALGRWRSSTLNLLNEACPRALDHNEAGVAYDRSVFGAGICAHAMLQGVGYALVQMGTRPADMDQFVSEVLAVVSVQLMSEGRRFDAGPIEVMTPDDVSQGAKLVIEYLATHELSREAFFEYGLAVDVDMRAVPYKAPYARLVGVLDVLRDEDQCDEDGAGGIVRVGLDYKTAWPAGPSWLDSLQAKCQTVLLWANAASNPGEMRGGLGKPDGVQVCVVNLRTHGRYSGEVLWLGDEHSKDVIDGYWREIQTVMRAADHTPRHAQPGPKCMGCRYAYVCDDCFAAAVPGHGVGPDEVAFMYAASLARTNSLRPLVVEACGPRGAIKVPGGEVGYHSAPTMAAKPDAPDTIADEWMGDGDDTYDSWMGMLKALKLGSGNINALAKALWPGRGPSRVDDFKERRAEFLEKTLEKKPGSEFGVWPF